MAADACKAKETLMNYCWSCQHEMKVGISLDDSEEQHICDSRWAKIPIHWRLLVTKIFRDKQPDLIGSMFDARN